MKIIADIRYTPQMTGDLFLPGNGSGNAASPCAVLIHGGGWTSMSRHDVRGIADFLVENGFAVFNIDYRLAPANPWPAGIEDCKNAVKYLLDSALPVDKKKIFVIGASAGGHYALISGMSLPQGTVCGIISISGIDDVLTDSKFSPNRYVQLLGKNPDANDLHILNPAEYCSVDSPPILCTHCLHDTVVPFAACRAFAKAAAQKNGNISVYSYGYGRRNQEHAIWIPQSSPHRLYGDLEKVISGFMQQVILMQDHK